MVLSMKQIESLLNKSGARSESPAQGSAEVRQRTDTFGAFEGKAGTPRRSRKGRSYRAPNGYVQFCPNWDVLRSRDYWGVSK